MDSSCRRQAMFPTSRALASCARVEGEDDDDVMMMMMMIMIMMMTNHHAGKKSSRRRWSYP